MATLLQIERGPDRARTVAELPPGGWGAVAQALDELGTEWGVAV